MANLKVLNNIDGFDYYWDFNHAKRILDEYSKNVNIRKNEVYKELSGICCITDGAVKTGLQKRTDSEI